LYGEIDGAITGVTRRPRLVKLIEQKQEVNKGDEKVSFEDEENGGRSFNWHHLLLL